jgi:hypothetical protein
MESAPIGEVLPAKSYFIPEEQFLKGGVNVAETTRYVFPDHVTRENFTSMVTGCFARSRGDGPALWAQFEWLRVHEQFDYKETLRNWKYAGGMSTLTPDERKEIVTLYKRIPAHEPYADIDIENAFHRNLVRMIYADREEPHFIEDFPEEKIKSYATREELFSGIDEYIREGKEKIT